MSQQNDDQDDSTFDEDEATTTEEYTEEEDENHAGDDNDKEEDPKVAVEFSRNVAVESAALEKLGYTVDQVKRKTIAQLTKELQEVATNAKEVTSPNRKKRVTFNREVSPPLRRNSVDALLQGVERVLRAKQAYTTTLEEDDDFTDADLHDWHQSIETLKRHAEQLRGSHLRALWERRQEKIKEMESHGLLEASLAQKWAEKQQQLRARFEQK